MKKALKRNLVEIIEASRFHFEIKDGQTILVNSSRPIKEADSGITEIKIKNIPTEVKEALKLIAQKEGITLSALIKSKLREIIRMYPEHVNKI